MRIAFIWPHGMTVYQTLPLALGILNASIAGQGHETKMFNLPLEGWTAGSTAFSKAIEEFAPDLVGISSFPTSFESAVAAARAIRRRRPEATTILGGNYATMAPREAYAAGCFDYVMRGECEVTFPRLIEALEAGDRAEVAEIPGIYYRGDDGREVSNEPVLHDDLDALVIDYDFIELERAHKAGYLVSLLGPRRKLSMLVTRGCEHACRFCTAPLMNGRELRHNSVEYVTREIRRVYDRYRVRMICFQDDNATQDAEFFKDLCRGIIALGLEDLKLEFYRGVRLENLDLEMLTLMKQAGFDIVTIAPESGSERVRALMGKNMRYDDIARVCGMIHQAGLCLQGYFIVGFPGETPAERKETYSMIRRLGFHVFSLHQYQALPGSAAFKRLVKEGRIAPDHTDSAHLIGDHLPNYNDDEAELSREVFLTYLGFYLRRPWAIVHLLRMASTGGLFRSLWGTTVAGIRSLLGRLKGAPGGPTSS